MSAFNRLALIAVAVLLLGIPVILLLVNFGVVSPAAVEHYTGYKEGLATLRRLGSADFTQNVRIVITVLGVLAVIVGLILLYLELRSALGLPVRTAFISREPGRRLAIRAEAVRALAAGAAQEAGARSASVSLSSRKRKEPSYSVLCRIEAGPPGDGSRSLLARKVRENVEKVLGDQQVPIREVEVVIERATS
jgi:hypothetical protein